ncbi:protein tyrosine phosphatase [Saccharicrinis carchari]|uniref:Protein tyrosine phosphatase n=2 Tax=Saccharicrinis carchari TaxID=1168039 RepID=A0A521ER21_SACCC|nr:protein tyrosine phosphatase [Saccharicrinis carchari]
MSKKKILFVCLGNICRSPSAEAVMTAKLKELDLSEHYMVDSAGITDYHEGGAADHRMQQHAAQRNYKLTSISRPFKTPNDFANFDYIIGMDDQNMSDLRAMATNDEQLSKLHKMTDYSSRFTYNEVPDPYYGGAEGFELVLDLLEDACDGLIKKLEDE